jgi:hypothetical protein
VALFTTDTLFILALTRSARCLQHFSLFSITLLLHSSTVQAHTFGNLSVFTAKWLRSISVLWISCPSTVLYHDVFSLLLLFCVASSIISTLRHDCPLRRRLILMDLVSHHSMSIKRVLHQDTNARATLLPTSLFLNLTRFLSGS